MPFVFSVRLYCLRPNIKLREKTRALTSEGILMLPEIDLQHDLIRNKCERKKKIKTSPNIFYRTKLKKKFTLWIQANPYSILEEIITIK